MRSYPFLQEFFTSVLSKSHGIGGRFHVSKKYGLEINSDQLGDLIKDEVVPVPGKKYPLAIMMPPQSSGNYVDPKGEWEEYRIAMFFLTTTFYTSNNQVKLPNPKTQTSTHTIPQDWHDMKRCAVNFLRVVHRVEKEQGLVQSQFRLASRPKIITPVSEIGVDRISGVRMDFNCSLFLGCTLEDYTDGDIATITIPAEDSHPEHNQ